MKYKSLMHQACPYTDCGSSTAFCYHPLGFGKCYSCNKSYPSRSEVFPWAVEKYPTMKDLKNASS